MSQRRKEEKCGRPLKRTRNLCMMERLGGWRTHIMETHEAEDEEKEGGGQKRRRMKRGGEEGKNNNNNNNNNNKSRKPKVFHTTLTNTALFCVLTRPLLSIVNSKLETMLKEAIMDYYKILS
jgi:hypothetical protein